MSCARSIEKNLVGWEVLPIVQYGAGVRGARGGIIRNYPTVNVRLYVNLYVPDERCATRNFLARSRNLERAGRSNRLGDAIAVQTDQERYKAIRVSCRHCRDRYLHPTR